jgi:hypothetical protein
MLAAMQTGDFAAGLELRTMHSALTTLEEFKLVASDFAISFESTDGTR